jgi:hypothetical protein
LTRQIRELDDVSIAKNELANSGADQVLGEHAP